MVGDGFQVKKFQLCFYPVVGLWPTFSKHFWLLEILLDSTSKKYGRWCLPSFANTTWFSHNAWWWDACSFTVKFELQSWELTYPLFKALLKMSSPPLHRWWYFSQKSCGNLRATHATSVCKNRDSFEVDRMKFSILIGNFILDPPRKSTLLSSPGLRDSVRRKTQQLVARDRFNPGQFGTRWINHEG